MARIRMLAKYDFTPLDAPALTVGLKAGCHYTVKDTWATELEFLGKAERVAVPPRPAAPRNTPPRRSRRRAGA